MMLRALEHTTMIAVATTLVFGATSLVNVAKSLDVEAIAYDRPIPRIPADFFVSFDNETIGRSIAPRTG